MEASQGAQEEQWVAIQERGAGLVIAEDAVGLNSIRTVAGLDIEWVSELEGICVAAVMAFPACDAPHFYVHRHTTAVPYKAGFLGFREVDAYLAVMKQVGPVDCVLVDGNGMLHPRQFGSACQFGLASGLPTIGVTKNLQKCCGDWTDKSVKEHMGNGGLLEFDLVDGSRALGWAVKKSVEHAAPVFVSVGHKISLETACAVVKRCMAYRVPEPIRQADIHAGRLAAQGFLG